MTRRDARIVALSALFCWEVGKIQPQEALRHLESEFWNQSGADISRGFDYAGKLVAAAASHAGQIDGAIDRASHGWPVMRMPKVDLCIIRLAVAEAVYLRGAPLEVVVDEALELAKEFGTHASPRFVNGVLMGVLREFGCTQ